MSMFGQKENENPQQTSAAPKRSESAQDIWATRLLTVSGDYAEIEGTFEIADSLDVECEIGGELNVRGRLTIGQNGAVNANVRTVDAVIKGTYEGNMIATGNITTDSLVISKGGFFNGNVTRIKEEDKKENRMLFQEQEKKASAPAPHPTPSSSAPSKPASDTDKKENDKGGKDDDGPGELERVVQSTRNV